jgi:hypothetical protein
LQHDREIAEPSGSGDLGRSLIGDARERLGLIADARVARLGLEHRERGIGPLQRALALDLEHRRDRCPAVDGEPDIARFVTDRDGLKMRVARHCQRDRAVDDRPHHPLGGNVCQEIFEHDRSPPSRKPPAVADRWMAPVKSNGAAIVLIQVKPVATRPA